MRGKTTQQLPIFLAVSVDHFVPPGHPLRGVRRLALEAMKELEPIFDNAYSRVGRASIPPEQLLLTLLLQALYGVRSERQICEQLQYNLLYRWFVGLELTDVAFDASTILQESQAFPRGCCVRPIPSSCRWTRTKKGASWRRLLLRGWDDYRGLGLT